MDMAQTFDGLSGAMERSGAQFGALPSELASWQGAASVNFLGPAGDALGAKANADQGMPWLENALRTGGSWGIGSLAAGLAGTLCAPGGPFAAGGCGAGGAILGGEAGDRIGGGVYDGLDWTYQNGVEPAGEAIYEKGIKPLGDKVRSLIP